MSEYHLKIVTPDRVVFDENAERVVARTLGGDVCILARHTDYVVPLAIGQVKVKKAGSEFRVGSCGGGTLFVNDGETTLMVTTFEWADEIDVDRAARAKEKAEQRIRNHKTDYELRLAEMKLKRALNRMRTGKG